MVRLVLFQLRMLPDMIQYVDYHCTLLQPLNTVLPPFLAEFSNQATLKSPGFENGNLDRPKPGMLIPNMFCTFVQIPHHDLVPFSAPLLKSIYTATMLINPNFRGSNLIFFQGSKIIVVTILRLSTATPEGGF